MIKKLKEAKKLMRELVEEARKMDEDTIIEMEHISDFSPLKAEDELDKLIDFLKNKEE